MMRTKTGIVCVLAALAVGACSWGNGSSATTSPDAAPVVCGDMRCDSSEVNNCPQDCGNGGGNQNAVCGNGQCETSKGESATSCPSDCGGGGSNAVCGDGTCQSTESSTTCPADCGGGNTSLNCSDPNTVIGCGLCSAAMICMPPYDAISCAACGGGLGSGLGSGLSLCTGGAPDGTCDSMEDNSTCPEDCP